LVQSTVVNIGVRLIIFKEGAGKGSSGSDIEVTYKEHVVKYTSKSTEETEDAAL
jgi:hypothetical protein